MKKSYVISIYREERLAVLHCDLDSDLPQLSYLDAQFIQRYVNTCLLLSCALKKHFRNTEDELNGTIFFVYLVFNE